MTAQTAAAFAPHVGTSFAVQAGQTPYDVTLVAVDVGPAQPGGPREEPFALLFSGPAGPGLEQATYKLLHPMLGEIALFLVPLQPLADGLTRYEAVFN